MNRIYVYNVINLIQELTLLRYNITNKPEHYEDFIMTAHIGGNIFICSRMGYKEITKKLREIFAGGDFILVDITKGISDKNFVIDTTDNEILRLNKLFGDISKANSLVDKDSSYFGESSESNPDVDIPTMDDLLDKINETGLESLDAFEKKLLKDYSK